MPSRAMAMAIAVVLLGGCQGGELQLRGRIAEFVAASEFAAPGPLASLGSLHAVVEGAQVVERLAPSQFEELRAAPGNRLLVLDVSVRNGDRRARVFSEGSLVAEDSTGRRSLSAPVDMLSDGFLSLQVLEPGDQVRGKIVFEVPYAPGGRFYWVSARGGRQVLVEPTPLADALPDRARVAMSSKRATLPSPATRVRAAALPPPPPARAVAAVPPARGRALATELLDEAGAVPALATAPATPLRRPTDPYALDAATQAACTGLVVRNDPAEKSRQLPFFERECRGYDLPVSWTLAYRNFFG